MFAVSTTQKICAIAGKTFRCAIGKNGATFDKVEGDGKTPLGAFPLLQIYWRKDKFDLPALSLPAQPILQDDGWCDDPKEGKYNQLVKLPFHGSHENLWRADDVYDIVVVIGHNRNPIIRGKGSAIFIHCARPDYAPTEGCVALAKEDLLSILPLFKAGMMVDIR